MGIRLGIGASDDQLLMITGNEDYNNTEIVCIARFDEHMHQASEPAYLIISSTFVTTSAPPSSFTNPPSNKIVPQMTIAIFKCQLPGAIISWSINGTSLRNFIPPLENITASTNSRADYNSSIDLLMVLARPEYNKTTVRCIGSYTDSRQPQYSPEVYLLIQGPLSEVTNIKRRPQVAELTWNAPFSLNLTDVEPDITYCIKVINKTCNNNNVLINISDVSKPYLEHETLSNADLFNITIIPKSNVLGAQAGLKWSIQELYIHFNVSAIYPVVRKVSGKTVDVTIYLRTNSLINEVPPDSFIVSLESLNGTTFRNFTSTSTIYTGSLEIHVPNVPYGDLWNCTIYATRCGGLQVSDITTLSTFDIQDIQATENGSIIVKCALINGSQAAGVLIVAYSLSDTPDIYYRVVPRKSVDQQEIQANISCLPGQSYNILLYVINDNGLPQENAASLPLTRSFNNQQSVDTDKNMCTELEIAYNISNQGSDVCIECHEPCIAIVHQNISQINTTNGFLNISRIILINTITGNETVRECIQGIDLINYQIGIISVILLNKNTEDQQPPDYIYNTTQTTNSTIEENGNATVTVIATVVSSVIAGILVAAAVIITIIAFISWKDKCKGMDSEEQSIGADSREVSESDEQSNAVLPNIGGDSGGIPESDEQSNAVLPNIGAGSGKIPESDEQSNAVLPNIGADSGEIPESDASTLSQN